MKSFNALYNRVAAWNALRYEQELDVQLALELLTEEAQETIEAKDVVEELDGLCDIVYVALGIVWKTGGEDIDAMLNRAELYLEGLSEIAVMPTFYYIAGHIAGFAGCPDRLKAQHAIYIARLAISVIEDNCSVSFDKALEPIFIVCDSNDTKEVKKTAANVKANKSKGEGFIDPAPRLKKWIEEVTNARLD